MALSSTMAAEVSSQSTADEENGSAVNTVPGIESAINLTHVVGTRFRPTDEILARHYLAGKVSGSTDGLIFPLIKQVDVYKCEPWLLSRDAHNFGDGIMYFFTALKMKYHTGTNVNRVAGDGFWRKTGNSSYVKGEDGLPIATKTPLAYYMNGQKPGESKKTQWLMKEFILERQVAEKSNTLALCAIYLHDKKRKQYDRGDQNVELDDQGALATEPNERVPCNYPSDVTDIGNCYQPQRQLSEPSTENLDFHQKQDSYNPEFNSSSNPSAAHDILPGVTIQAGNSNQNFSNREIESQGATDTKMNYLNDQSSLSDFLPLEDFDEEEFLNHSLEELRRLVYDNKLPPEVSEDHSRTAGPVTNNDYPLIS